MAAPSECHASQDEGDKKVPPKILPCEDVNDTWDPMEDDFKDPNFNHYTHGPAKYAPNSKVQASFPRRLGPGMENYSETYRVHIKNVPLDMDEDGITMLVTKVAARPINVFKKREEFSTSKVSWALVEFTNHNDAKKTIESLHNIPPLHLNVQYAFTEAEKAKHAREREERRRSEEEEAAHRIREPVNEMLATLPDAQPVGMDKFPGDENREKRVGGRGLPLNPPCRLTSWPQEPRAGSLSQHAAATVNLNEQLDPLYQNSELDYFGQYAGGYNDDATAVISKAVDKLQRDYHPVNSRSRNFGGRGYYMPIRANERKPGGLRHSSGRAYNPVQHTGLSNPKNEAPWERPKKVEFVGANGGSGLCGECNRNTSLRCVRCHAWFCSEACLDVAGMHPYKCEVSDLVDPYWKANFVSRGAGSENRSAPQQQQHQQANGHQDQPPGPEYIEPNYGAGRGLPKQPESVLNPNSANFKPSSSSSQTLVDSSLPRVKQFSSKPSFLAHKSQVPNPPETSTKAIPEPTLPKPESNKVEEPPETKSTETIIVQDTTVKPGIIKTHSQNPKPSFNKKGDIPQQKGGKTKGRSRSKGHNTPSPKNNSRTNTPERKGVNSNNLIACSKDSQEEPGKSDQKSFPESCSPVVRGVNSHNLITCSESSPESDSQVPTPVNESPSLQCDKKSEMPPWPNVPTVNLRLSTKVSNVAQNESSSRPKESQSKPADLVQQVEAKSQQPEVQTEGVESKNQSAQAKPTAAQNQPMAAEPVKAVSEKTPTRQPSPSPAKTPTAKPVSVQTTPVQGQSVEKQQKTVTPSQSANTTTVPAPTSMQNPPPQAKQTEATKQVKSQPSSQLNQTEAPEPKYVRSATTRQVAAKSQPSSPKPPGKTFASSLKNQTTPQLNTYHMPLGPHNIVPFKPSLPNPNKSWASTLKSQPESKLPQVKSDGGNLEPSNFPPPLLNQQQHSPQQPQPSPSRDQPDFSIPPPNMSPKPATPTQNVPSYPHAMSPNNAARVQSPMAQSKNVHNQASPGSVASNPMAQNSPVQNPMAQRNVLQSPTTQHNTVPNSMAQRNSVQGPIAQNNPMAQGNKNSVAQQNTMKSLMAQNITLHPSMAQRNTVQGPMQNSMQNPMAQNHPVQTHVAQNSVVNNPMAPQNVMQNPMAQNSMQKQMGPGNVTHDQMRPGNPSFNQMMPSHAPYNQIAPGNIAQNQMMPGNAMHMGRGNPMHGNMGPAGNVIHGQMGPGSSVHNNMGPGMHNQMAPGNFAQNHMGPGNPVHTSMGPGNPVHSNMGPGNPVHTNMGPGNPVHTNMRPGNPVHTNMGPGNPMHSQMGPGNVAHNHMAPCNPMQQHMAQAQQLQAVAAHHMQPQVPNYTAQTGPFRSPSVSPHKPTVPMHRGRGGCQQQISFSRNQPAQNEEKIPNIPPFPAQFQNPDYYTQRRSSRGPRYPQNQRTNWRNNYQNKQWQSKPNRYSDRNPTPPINTESTQQQNRPSESTPLSVTESNTPVARTSPTASPPKEQSKPPTPVPQISPATSPPVTAKPIAATDTAQSIPATDTAAQSNPATDQAKPTITSSQPPCKPVEDKVLPEKEVEAKVPEAKTEETKDNLTIQQVLESIATSNPKVSSSEMPDIPELSLVEASMVAQQLREEETEVACESVQDDSTDVVQTPEVVPESAVASKPVQAAAIQNPELPKCVEDRPTPSNRAEDADEVTSIPESSEVEDQAAVARDTQESATSSEQNKVQVKSKENTGDMKSYEKPPRHQNPPSNQQHRHRQARQRSYGYPEQQVYPQMCLIPVTQPQQPPMVYSPEYNAFVVMSPVPQEQEYPSASGTPDYEASNFYPVEEYYEPQVQYFYPQASPEQEYYASESEASSTDQYVPANTPQYSTMTATPMYYPSPSPEVGNEYSEQEPEGAAYMEPVYQMQYPNQQVVYMTPSYAPKEPDQQYAQYPAQMMYQQPGYPQQQMVPVVPQYYNTVYQQPMMLPGPMPPPSPSPQAYAPQMASPQPYVPQMPSSQAYVPHHHIQAYAPPMQAQQSYVPQNPQAYVPAAVQPQYRILPRPPGAGIVLPPHLVPEKPMQ